MIHNNLKKIRKDWQDKKILILGFGKEGINSLKFLRKIFPDKILGVGDRDKDIKNQTTRDKKIKWHLGISYLESLKDYDIIIKSPGISNNLPEIKSAVKNKKITSQTEIFFNYYPGKIIAITGTKGKGTTSSLIYQVLKNGLTKKNKIYLGGNIGSPVLSFLFESKKSDIFIFEISSHQLINLKISPEIAVLLNIVPAHLDFFKNFKEYQKTKENITLRQTEKNILIYQKRQSKNLDNIAKKTKAQKISFSINTKKADCFVNNNYVFFKKEKIFNINENPLKGDFNILNIMPAIIIGKIFKISSNKIIKTIKKFKGLPYRLEFIGNYSGIEFYNDSLATVPEATISAIKSMNENLETIILGGSNSNLNYKDLAMEILKSNINNLICFPVTGEQIWKEVIKQNPNKNRRIIKYFPVDNMEKAINLAFKHTKKGKICLLSPASPSFSIFKNYKERGDLFNKYVKERKKKN